MKGSLAANRKTCLRDNCPARCNFRSTSVRFAQQLLRESLPLVGFSLVDIFTPPLLSLPDKISSMRNRYCQSPCYSSFAVALRWQVIFSYQCRGRRECSRQLQQIKSSFLDYFAQYILNPFFEFWYLVLDNIPD